MREVQWSTLSRHRDVTILEGTKRVEYLSTNLYEIIYFKTTLINISLSKFKQRVQCFSEGILGKKMCFLTLE